jgi:hypothetical protein
MIIEEFEIFADEKQKKKRKRSEKRKPNPIKEKS